MILTNYYKSIFSIIAILLFWETASGGLIPSASQTIMTLIQLLSSIDFLENVAISLQRLGIGWIIGTFIGTCLGMLIGYYTGVRAFFMPVVSALFPIPKIALLPLFLILFGLGETSKIATIFIGAFFPSIITAYSASSRVPTSLTDAARTCGAASFRILRTIVFPYSLPTIIQGFRTSTSISLTLLVAAEMLGATKGLGYWVYATGGSLQFDQMLAGIICLSIIGLLISYICDRLYKNFCSWSESIEGNN